MELGGLKESISRQELKADIATISGWMSASSQCVRRPQRNAVGPRRLNTVPCIIKYFVSQGRDFRLSVLTKPKLLRTAVHNLQAGALAAASPLDTKTA